MRSESTRVIRTVAVLAWAGLAWGSAALGQVATPPPRELPPADQGIEPQQPPRVVPNFNDPARQNAQPAARPAPRPRPELPDLPYVRLAEKDEAGNWKSLNEPLHVAAIRRNPSLPEGFLERAEVQEYLKERRATVIHVLVANLDLVEEIDGGLFERVNFREREGIRLMLDKVRPLQHPAGPRALIDELRERGLADDVQREFTNRIIREYVLDLAPPAIPAGQGTQEEREQRAFSQLIALYKQTVEEYMFLYNQVRSRSHELLDSAVAGLTLDEDTRSKVTRVVEHVRAASPAERADSFDQLKDILSLEQRKELMRAMLNALGT